MSKDIRPELGQGGCVWLSVLPSVSLSASAFALPFRLSVGVREGVHLVAMKAAVMTTWSRQSGAMFVFRNGSTSLALHMLNL